MSWITDEYGEKKYKISLYCKEELPTWDELYKEFYVNKIFDYDPDVPDQQSLDPYWRIPRRKMLLSWACNQLNKMIFEDKIDAVGFMDKFNLHCDSVHFILAPNKQDPETFLVMSNSIIDKNKPPRIYTCKIPSTDKYSIFLTEHPRIDIDAISKPVELIAVLSNTRSISAITSSQANPDVLEQLITFIMKDVIGYFENGVGWKDKDGQIIPSDPMSHGCSGVGYDPAL